MATQIPLVIGTTVPIQQLPTGDTLSANLTVSEPNVILGRLTTGAGGHEEIKPATLTEETAPAAGDFLPIWTGDGLRKVDFSGLGGGGGGDSLGTGFTSGGGSGTVPDGTVMTLDGDFTIDGPLLLDGGDGSQAKRILLATIDSWGATFEMYNTDDGYLSLEYHSAATETTSVISFSGDGFDMRTYYDDNSAISQMLFRPNQISFVHKPRQITNAQAVNGELYYSSTNGKLCFKDLGGTVQELY